MNPAGESAPPEISEGRVLKGGLVVAVGLVSAQIAGFIRQATIGYLLGTGRQADALSAAMAPIELWWSVMGLVVIFGFVPRFSNPDPKQRYAFKDILWPMSRLALASTICFAVFADVIVHAFAPGLDAETASVGAQLLRLMSLAPLAIGCGFVYSALLLSHRRFAIPSFHHATVNLATVAAALLFYRQLGVFSFAVGYVSGAWIQLGVAHTYSRRLPEDKGVTARRTRLRDLLARPAPILVHALSMELNTAVTRAYASTFGAGMTAAFDYGFKLFRVPMALLVVPLSQSLLPEVSSQQENRPQQRLVLRAVTRAAWLAGLSSVGVMLGMMALRHQVVAVLFQRGAFTRTSTNAVSTVLLSYMPVIVGRGLCDLLSRTLFGMGRFRAGVTATVTALVLNLVICSALPSEDPLLIGLGAIVGFTVGAVWIVSQVVRMQRDV